MDPLTTFLLSLTSGLFVAVVTAIVTVRLALQRFRAEKWWERKAEAYSAIVESLFHMQNYLDKELESDLGERDLAKEERDKLSHRFAESLAAITKAVAIGTFIISDEAASHLNNCLQSIGTSYQRAKSVTEAVNMDLGTVRDCLTKMRACAKKDLGVK